MLALFSRNMCCSIRDKDGRPRSFGLGAEMPHFNVSEVESQVENPSMMAFAPLWQSNAVCIRRLALASEREVSVYNLSSSFGDDGLGGPHTTASSSRSLQPERTLALEEGQAITSMLFRDEDSSRHLLVAYGPAVPSGQNSARPSTAAGRYRVRVWACEPENAACPEKASDACAWRLDEGYVASLEDHASPVTRLAVSSTYLLTADQLGECRVWQKTRNFQPRAVARLHQSGGISDLAVDRLFAYSVGGQDLAIRVWSMPDLKQVLTISTDSVDCVPTIPSGPGSEAPSMPPCTCRLAQLTAVKRPASRWSGAQGSSRNSGTPRGMLFVAGTLADKQDESSMAMAGAGVLMEWALGSSGCQPAITEPAMAVQLKARCSSSFTGVSPTCQSAQIAHESPIVALAYGPYDNGPLVTADAWGVFRIWDYTPRLWCSQQLLTGDLTSPTTVAIAVDPLQRTLYSIVGSKRLSVWRQHSVLPADAPA